MGEWLGKVMEGNSRGVIVRRDLIPETVRGNLLRRPTGRGTALSWRGLPELLAWTPDDILCQPATHCDLRWTNLATASWEHGHNSEWEPAIRT